MTGTDDAASHAASVRMRRCASLAKPIVYTCAALISLGPATVFGDDIPYPPVVELPPEIVQPSVDLPAPKWRALYCLDWEDGCTECRRKTLTSDVYCKDKISDKKFCSREKRFSICTSDDNIGRFCSSMQYYIINPADYDGKNLEPFLSRHREGQSLDFAWDFDDTLPGSWFARDLSTLPGRLGPNRCPRSRRPTVRLSAA